MPVDDNVEKVVPFFEVKDIQASVRFYVDGLAFRMTEKWEVDGQLRWCALRRGGAELMLQTFARKPAAPAQEVGTGVTIYFVCADALAIYRDAVGRGLDLKVPFVGNGMWVTCLVDPDGYQVAFESPTDLPEETVYSELSH